MLEILRNNAAWVGSRALCVCVCTFAVRLGRSTRSSTRVLSRRSNPLKFSYPCVAVVYLLLIIAPPPKDQRRGARARLQRCAPLRGYMRSIIRELMVSFKMREHPPDCPGPDCPAQSVITWIVRRGFAVAIRSRSVYSSISALKISAADRLHHAINRFIRIQLRFALCACNSTAELRSWEHSLYCFCLIRCS